MKKTVFGLIIYLTTCLFVVGSSFAGMVVIYPSELTPSASYGFEQDPWFVRSSETDGFAEFFKIIKLPLNKMIKRIEYSHYGSDLTPSTVETQVALLRTNKKTGESDILGLAMSDHEGPVKILVSTDNIANNKVSSRYIYWIGVYSANFYSRVFPIKIYY